MDKPHVDRLVGTRVAQYEILARRGGGGMGVVYQARDTRLGRTVALKCLPPLWSNDALAQERFVREAQAASATDHPNICTIHDIAATDEGQLFIVMAYYDGETLKERLTRGPLPLDDALDIATQVSEGLAKAHANGVVHRDIKPGNLMLTEEAVKIVDFGLAKFADALQLTMGSSTLGTAAYMSPEQVRGEEVDARTDVWSAGVVLYEMLAGHPPFRGTHAEAIAYAIRYDAPAPLRALRPEIPEEVEQLVFRALHKDPAVRFQSARELARALRRARGQTLPQDLRTAAVPVPDLRTSDPAGPPSAAGSPRGLWSLASALLVIGLVAAPTGWWLLTPAERIPVVVAPILNQYHPALDAHRLALTHTLERAIADVPGVRVLPWSEAASIIRPALAEGIDVSDPAVLQRLIARSGASLVLRPMLVNEGGALRARLEFQNAGTLTPAGYERYETEAVSSSLIEPTAYRLVQSLSTGVELRLQPARVRLLERIRHMAGRGSVATIDPGMPEAATAFEEGTFWYGELEYAEALRAFTRAVEIETQASRPHALLSAWASRTAMIMRLDADASRAADVALQHLTPDTPPAERLFVDAVAAESRRDMDTAGASYEQLVSRRRDDPRWLMELAAFQDRRGTPEAAVDTYHRALQLDPQLARASLELCRLYSTLNEPVKAREYGERAFADFQQIGSRGGEAQALLCLADTTSLVARTAGERDTAALQAADAVSRFQQLGYEYSVARGYYYQGFLATDAGNYDGAITFFERAFSSAVSVGNAALQPKALVNLGAAHLEIGERARALAYYRQSYVHNQRLNDEYDAARSRVGAGALLIEHGDQQEGRLDVQAALTVFQRRGDRQFEVYARRLLARSFGYAAEFDAAEQEFQTAVSLAAQHGLRDAAAAVRLDLARMRFARGDYAGAEAHLQQVIAGGSARFEADARLSLARTYTRLGDFAAAESALASVPAAVDRGGALEPLWHLTLGELAAERGRERAARTHFAQAAGLWRDDLPDAASVEARARLGVLNASRAGPAAIAEIDAARVQAARMGRVMLDVQVRLALAEALVAAGRGTEALTTLDGMPHDRTPSIGPELRAQWHHWRARAHRLRGNVTDADAEAQEARDALDAVRRSVPPQYRDTLLARRDLRLEQRD